MARATTKASSSVPLAKSDERSAELRLAVEQVGKKLLILLILRLGWLGAIGTRDENVALFAQFLQRNFRRLELIAQGLVEVTVPKSSPKPMATPRSQ